VGWPCRAWLGCIRYSCHCGVIEIRPRRGEKPRNCNDKNQRNPETRVSDLTRPQYLLGVGRAFRPTPVLEPVAKVGPAIGETRKASRHGLRVGLGYPEARPQVTDSSRKVLTIALSWAGRQVIIFFRLFRPHRSSGPAAQSQRPPDHPTQSTGPVARRLIYDNLVLRNPRPLHQGRTHAPRCRSLRPQPP